MTFNFKKLLSPEQQKLWDENKERVIKEKIRFANLTNENLVVSAQYFLSQMKAPREWLLGDCVYDAEFYHIIIHELLRRIKEGIKR